MTIAVVATMADDPREDPETMSTLLDQLSGMTGWRLHDLRRTCVSGMDQLDVGPPCCGQNP